MATIIVTPLAALLLIAAIVDILVTRKYSGPDRKARVALLTVCIFATSAAFLIGLARLAQNQLTACPNAYISVGELRSAVPAAESNLKRVYRREKACNGFTWYGPVEEAEVELAFATDLDVDSAAAEFQRIAVAEGWQPAPSIIRTTRSEDEATFGLTKMSGQGSMSLSVFIQPTREYNRDSAKENALRRADMNVGVSVRLSAESDIPAATAVPNP